MKILLQQGISNQELYADLTYLSKSLEIQTYLIFSNVLLTVKKVGYILDIMRQTACLVFNPVMVEGYVTLFSCTAVVEPSDSLTAPM